nr:serine hydrolase [Comamonas jiangduensis]
MKKWVLGTLVVVAAAGVGGWFSLDKETRGLLATVPTNRDILFWTQSQRDAAFRALDRLPVLAKVNVVPASASPSPLPLGAPLQLKLDVDAIAGQRSAALLVVPQCKLRLDRHRLGFDGAGRRTSFSVAKSFTSTLLGAAVMDGFIQSLDDKVSVYIPELKGSAYDDVSVRQLLTMTSGVQWNEDYADPNSDVAKFNNHQPEPGVEALVSYMRQLPRAAPPEPLALQHGETNLVARWCSALPRSRWPPTLPRRCGARRHGATGHLDFEQNRQGNWRLLPAGLTRDYARMGLFILNGAKVNGQSIVPDDWWAQATTKRATMVCRGEGMAISGGPMTTAAMRPAAFLGKAFLSTPIVNW